ncbi:hypothetical protein B0H13DRAFT_2669768, partial [Mycena leptocephala]
MNPNIYDPHNDPNWLDFRGRVAGDLADKATLLGTPQTLATEPTPLGFPIQWRQTLDWQTGGYLHFFQFRIQYIAPSDPNKPSIWKAYGKARVQGTQERPIGYVEIDALIYQDPGPLLDRLASGQLMLELMSKAVLTDTFIRVALEAFPAVSPQNEVFIMERMVARSSLPQPNAVLSNVVEIFRERAIPRRVCSMLNCGEFLPVLGPDYCFYCMRPAFTPNLISGNLLTIYGESSASG